MQLLRKFSKFNKLFVPLKGKKVITIVNSFQKILDNSMKLHPVRKPNKIWVDKGSELYRSSFKNG